MGEVREVPSEELTSEDSRISKKMAFPQRSSKCKPLETHFTESLTFFLIKKHFRAGDVARW